MKPLHTQGWQHSFETDDEVTIFHILFSNFNRNTAVMIFEMFVFLKTLWAVMENTTLKIQYKKGTHFKNRENLKLFENLNCRIFWIARRRLIASTHLIENVASLGSNFSILRAVLEKCWYLACVTDNFFLEKKSTVEKICEKCSDFANCKSVHVAPYHIDECWTCQVFTNLGPKLSLATLFFLNHNLSPYLIFVIFFTQAKFLENKIYTEKTHKLRQNTQ